MYNRIYKKTKVSQLSKQISGLFSKITDGIDNMLTPPQKESWKIVIEALESYRDNITKRTKKNKEQLSTVTELLTKLVTKTCINLHTFLHLKYKINTNVTVDLGGIKTSTTSILVEDLNKSIEMLSNYINELELENLYIKNTNRNLDADLYTFLQKPEKVVPKYHEINWSKLTVEQQIECLKLFAKVHFEKYPNGNFDKLTQQLVDWYTNKRLVYRNIKWNKGIGQITEIRGLAYDKTTDFYTLRKQTSSSSISKTTIDPVKLNNELLNYIIQQKKTTRTKLQDIVFDKQHFWNHMKTKFHDVTFGKSTKMELLDQLTKMYDCLVSSET
jgi:hypothetical protein